ncbi:conjugal transfer protein TraG N-terminal domain-containing protein [Vibrio anguillarum]|uniref:conjugal transfer protein TraG N-terminal domain-containing protein n=3 Tax=Vibrio anguillarum TaxID=55601 RepID=UPI000BB50451|nr:conjugal transfer protein TraG N-terminal domain-containing protein [Vibrio anguillarum]ATC56794.1 conjugal transfer protein TraG [Vibrio anguillarum]MBF4251655.1 conjugal transfer protein TraG [Vibrio anguillarum]MBF4389318.1 conjugal transfer protein TraG [Vibrio anguillarum]MBF4401934.1 conjugal transfer protein TraG [Vibrio anguillarum]
MWEIYSIGDSAFLEQVLNAVAMITGTGDFTSMVRIGLLIGVLMVSVQALMQGGRGINFQHVLVSWLVFATMFGPSTRVSIEDAYTGQVRVVDNVPIGVAAAGSTISTVGFQITRLFETAFSTPAMTEYGFASSLQSLIKVRKQVMDRSGLGDANRVAGSDIEQSWFNYIKECTLIGIDIGQKNLDQVLSDPNPMTAIRFDSRIYGTRIMLSGSSSDLDCTDAYSQLKLMTESTFIPRLKQVLSASLGTSSATDTDDVIRNALNNLGLASVNTQEYMTASVLLPIYEQSVTGKYMDDQAFTAAVMVNQAIEQRNTQWAAEQTLFQSIVRPMMTFFEGFIYAITPLMAFVIALGQIGMRMAGKYLLILLWIQLWMPVMAIINLYIHLTVAGKMSALDAFAGTEVPSFAGMMQMDSVLQTWIATGGMLASSVPAISLMLVYGSAITATHLAGRLQNGDAIDEKMASPDVAKNAPVMQSQSMFQNSALTGSAMTGASNLLSSFSVGNAVGSMVGSAKESMTQATQAFSRQVGNTMSRTFGEKLSYDNLSSVGRQIGSSNSASSAVVNQVTDDLQTRYGFGDDKKDAVRGLVSGVLSGGLRVGGDGTITNTGDKEVADKGFLGRLLGTGGNDSPQGNLPGVDKPESSRVPKISRLRAGLDLGGNFSGQVESSEGSSRSTTANTLTGEMQSLASSDSRRAEYRDAMVKDLSDSRRSGVEMSLSNQDYQSLQSSAQDVITASNRFSELDQASYSLSGQRNTDGATLTRLAADNPEVMDYLGRYMNQHVEAGNRLRENLPMYQRLLPDDNQAYVAAAMESLTYSNSSTPAERDNDYQAAMTVMAMATGADLRSIQPRSNEGLSSAAPTFGGTQSQVESGVLGGYEDAATVQTQFNSAQSAYQANLSGVDGQLNTHQQQAQQAVASDTSTYQSELNSAAGSQWRSRIMADDSGVSGAEMFFNSASAIGDFSGKHTDAALHTLNHFGEDYESYKEQALEDPGSRGFLHNATVASKSTWDGLKAAVDAGTSLENPLTAFNDAYSGSSSQYASEVNWGTKSEAMLAGAFGAAVNNRYGEFLEQYADDFKQEAYSEGQRMGLTPIQSQVFAQAFNEGLAGRVFNSEDSSSWSPEMLGLREQMLNEYRQKDESGAYIPESVSEEDKAFVDKQIAVISNASLAGDYAQNNLIDIRAYNQASGRN